MKKCIVSEYFKKKNSISCEFEGNAEECIKGEHFDVCPVDSWSERMGSEGVEPLKFGSGKGWKFPGSIVHGHTQIATCGCESKLGVQLGFCPDHRTTKEEEE